MLGDYLCGGAGGRGTTMLAAIKDFGQHDASRDIVGLLLVVFQVGILRV